MFGTWKEFKEIFFKENDLDKNCESCGMEDFDLLSTEKDESDDSLTAIFICKNCGIQKEMAYRELETN